MNREIGMDMCEYRWICGYEDILVLVYRQKRGDIGMMRKRQRYIDRKGLIQGRGGSECGDIDIELLIINANAPCNIIACSSRHNFDFLEIAGNVQKFIDLYGKSAKNCRKSSYDNWLLSYKYIIM